MSYGATGSDGLSPPTQAIMKEVDGSVFLQKEFQIIDMCGIEGPNHYVWHRGSEGTGPVLAYTREESGCLYRAICSNARAATFFTHQTDRKGPIAIKMTKEQNCLACCLCTAHEAKVADGSGYYIGKVALPWWKQFSCKYSGKAQDSNAKERYEINGTCCQAHACCPCFVDFMFEITDADEKKFGSVTRHALGVRNCCGLSATYAIEMPPRPVFKHPRADGVLDLCRALYSTDATDD
jgi:hypothetical protein